MSIRDKRTLNEAVGNLVYISDIIESVRHRLDIAGAQELEKAQIYLSHSIDWLKASERRIKKADFDKLVEVQKLSFAEEELKRGDK